MKNIIHVYVMKHTRKIYRKRPIRGRLTLKNFSKAEKGCYDRTKRPNLAVVDTHLHLRPFGGPPFPFTQLVDAMKQSGILFAEGYGIGQRLPTDSSCTYYLDCPNVAVKPSLKNDMFNAQTILDAKPSGIVINLSMTFADLSKPEEILHGMRFLEKEYPNMFHWLGEVNLVKQAIFNNGHKPVPIKTIPKWKPFMKELRKRNMPIAIHSDLGNNSDQYKYLPLMKEVLRLYPNNKIVWLHLGISAQLTNIDPKEHVQLMDGFLSKYPHLYFDISWRVLNDQEFYNPQTRAVYVELFNKWPKRFLPGTDFLASANKNAKIYKKELQITSAILKDLNDDAFRRIALGQNYFDISRMSQFQAPQICQ